MTQPYSELKSHIDQLWKIIEQQDNQIQELKKSNNTLCSERDGLQEKLKLALSTHTCTNAVHDKTEQPTLPARSPYRSFNSSEADITALKDRKLQVSSSCSLSTTSQEPISPKIIQHDAKLFAQYQSAVLKRDTTTTQADSHIALVPSKSSTLPRQSHEARMQQRKQHNSMVFSPSTVIPTRMKKEDPTSPSSPSSPLPTSPPSSAPAAAPPSPPPHHHHHSLPAYRKQTQQYHPHHQVEQQDPSLNSTMQLNSITDITIKVIGSMLKSNKKGKDVVSFILSVGKQSDDHFEELWRVQKLYSDFLDLDLKLKSQMGLSRVNKETRLPERQLFTTRSPNKLEQRRIALEKYLCHIITLSMNGISDFCEFLSTDVIEQSSYMNQGNKEGYLTKRGKNFGGWKTRYFTLINNRLDYYESKDGTKLGSILLDGAQIGRQTPQNSGTYEDNNNESVYRHAILILEYKKTSLGNYVRHILCASSDSDRDEWITALLQAIQAGNNNSSNSNSTETDNTVRRSNSNKQRKKSSSSDKQRKLSKDEIRTVSATPISHIPVDSTHFVDMEKLTSAPSKYDHYPTSLIIDSTPSDSTGHSPASNTLSPSSTITSFPSSSLLLSSPLSASSTDSPSSLLQQHQQRHSLARTDSSLDERVMSPQSRSDSPIPTATFDRRESDDSVSHSSNGAHYDHPHQQNQQVYQDKKSRTKSTNRMTLWGKKVFGNQQQRPFSSSSPTSPVNNVSSNAGISTFVSGSTISSMPPSSSSSASHASQQQQDQQQPRGNAAKSLRQILSRPTNQTQQQDHSDDISPSTYAFSDQKFVKQFVPGLSKSSQQSVPESLSALSSCSPNTGKQVFGVPLEEAVRISRVFDGYPLPAVVFRCIEFLDAKNAVLEEGLYRLSGSNAVLQQLKKKFNQEGDIALLHAKEDYDVHVVAGLLKMWLRELPVSVLTRELRPEFIQVIDLLERNDRINELGRLVSKLPLANYTLLRILTSHLIRVVKHSDVNLMTVRNISIVFSPTLGIPGTIFNLFLSEFDYIFWTNKDGDAAPRRVDEENHNCDDGDVDADDITDNGYQDDEDETTDVNKSGLDRQPTMYDQIHSLQQVTPSSKKTNGESFLTSMSSVAIPRQLDKKLMAVRKDRERSNRNSVLYIDAAPDAIVDLEKHANGGTCVAEEDEELDELALSIVETSDDIQG